MPELITNGRCIPYDPDLVDLAKKLRLHMTPQERKLWSFLRTIKPRYYRQKPLVYYIVDFYCPAKRLVIELDGKQHNAKENKEYDLSRTEILNNFGISVIRFSNFEIDEYFDDVLKRF